MKITILIVFLFLTSLSFAQIFDHEEGWFYKKPGDVLEQKMEAEYHDEQFDITEIKLICRKTVWERKYHEGRVWVPNHSNGTWKAVRAEGYFWTFKWSDWYFCDEE
jgi:hypothetical protein